MGNIIPREKIKHLEWTGEQDSQVKQDTKKELNTSDSYITNERILQGRSFSDDDLSQALENALVYGGNEGVVTMPELISARVKAEKDHFLWQNHFDVHTEEYIGIDHDGILGSSNRGLVLIVHGGGLLTPDQIREAYDKRLENGSAVLTQDEFNQLLRGENFEDREFPLYGIDEIQEGVSGLPHRFGVYMSFSEAQSTKSGYHDKTSFLANRLVIARNGGTQNLEAYFGEINGSEGSLGNWHIYSDKEINKPSGRLLFLGSGDYGLDGNVDLYYLGRFLGVAPEARAKK